MVHAERRQFLITGSALLAAPFAARAQCAERIYRIGFVSMSPPGPRDVAFVQGLRELGYVDGQNVSIEMRCRAGAQQLKTRLDVHQATNPSELDAALVAIGSGCARGLIVTPSPFFSNSRVKLVQFAERKRLPAIYFFEDFADAGGLMSYGPSITHSYRRAGSYVDKILKGAKPADLPVEQPTKFELVVNLKTARTLGLKFPQSVVLRADRVVE